MKKTKEKILDTALRLFNTKGLSKVTLRTIADEMGISQGNLNYHFKKREDIIEALYFRLVKIFDDVMSQTQSLKPDLKMAYDMTLGFMTNFYEYRFILFDFTQIIRENNKIKMHHKALIEVRQTQFLSLLNRMSEEGIIRKEELPNEYTGLCKRVLVFGDFWMASLEIEKSNINQKIIKEYLEIMMQSIYPYLTKKGIGQYKTVFDSHS